MELLAGALLERPPGRKYLSELRFAELAPQPPLPKPDTLKRWRAELPSGFELALRVPDSCWKPSADPLVGGAERDSGIEWLNAAADALDARAVVVSTGPEVTTGARDRERLRRFFERIPPKEGRLRVWRASGLWEPEAIAGFSRALDVVGAVDPVDQAVPPANVVYAHLLAEGLRRSFSHALLAETLDAIQASGAERAYVSIASPQSFREASLLQSLSEGRV